MKLRPSILFPALFALFLAIAFEHFVFLAGNLVLKRGTDTPGNLHPSSPQPLPSSADTPTLPSNAPSDIAVRQPAVPTDSLADRMGHQWNRLHAKITEFSSKAPPFRDALARWDASWTYRVSKTVRSRQVARADNGWLFYMTRSDGDTIADFRGESRFSAYETDLLRRRLLALRDALAQRDIDFCFLVAPGKENIYPEFVPQRFRRGSPQTRSDVLLATLRATTDLPLPDVKGALLAHKPIRLVYYEFDSHWNRAGAYLAAQAALEALGRPSVPIENRQVDTAPSDISGSDLADLTGISALHGLHSTEHPVRGVLLLRPERAAWKLLGTVENPGARTQDRLLLLGDSFKTELAPPFTEEFRWVSDVHWEEATDLGKLLDDRRPDAVVLEFAERYLPLAAEKIARFSFP